MNQPSAAAGTDEDNFRRNYITISVGMDEKQVVGFTGFQCTRIFPGRIFSLS